ncbi:hypothetical protein IWZ01DRAFT_493662 [Phyllosticta capitalensis]
MRFLRWLPFAAALAAALPEVKTPNKDIAVVKRDPVPCDTPDGVGGGCYNPGNYHYTIYDVKGVVIYDLTVEGTSSSYTVAFYVYNPNTDWWAKCSSDVQNSPDYQTCDRLRTLFIFNIDDNELTKSSSTVTLTVRWIYSPGALPRALEAAKGNTGNEDDYKDLVYYQEGDVRIQIDCSGQTTSSESTSNYQCPPDDYSCGQPMPSTVSCKFTGTITVTAKILEEGEPSDNHKKDPKRLAMS